ncbi:uncharacterized protein BXZ73DRAFT_102089 [Epithele typhae]|uniref:uncharacterized protein n=1 Tax=Epithele typhae TaxID=378194 RepID=UPI0020085871|nr:uncharacterized protein BXZ73DRAFT_102089 [Epithele typhae]KAH9929560.1 hypothetical protein BXZ73DRAFT_102089 [Epithele typhae]
MSLVLLPMNSNYPGYYSPSDSASSPNPRPNTYSRSSDHASPSQPYSQYAQHPSLSASVSQSYASSTSYSPQHPQQGYHSPPAHNMLPPIAPGYSTRDGRHDVSSGYSIGPTLHDLPFTARGSPSSSSSSPHSTYSSRPDSWHASSRSPTGHHTAHERAPTYPPPARGAGAHPSLSQSTSGSHLIPTPAQVSQSFHHQHHPHHPHPHPSAHGGYLPHSHSLPHASAAALAAPSPQRGGPIVAAIPAASAAAAPVERFYCDRCDKSFGRAHDKKRHYESTHMQHSHTCRFCNKTFSRNDSLKRHQDNGCDKDPEMHP